VASCQALASLQLWRGQQCRCWTPPAAEYEDPPFLDQLQTSEVTAALGRDTAARLGWHADLVFRRPAHEAVQVCPGESQLALNTLRLLEEVTNDSNFRQVPACTRSLPVCCLVAAGCNLARTVLVLSSIGCIDAVPSGRPFLMPEPFSHFTVQLPSISCFGAFATQHVGLPRMRRDVSTRSWFCAGPDAAACCAGGARHVAAVARVQRPVVRR